MSTELAKLFVTLGLNAQGFTEGTQRASTESKNMATNIQSAFAIAARAARTELGESAKETREALSIMFDKVDVSRLTDQLKEGGEQAQAAIQEIQDKLSGIENEAQRAALGTKIFGDAWEAVESGALSAEEAASAALNKMNASTMEAREVLAGLFDDVDADRLISELEQGGDAAKSAAREISVAMAGVEDDTQRAEMGVAIFGESWQKVEASVTSAMGVTRNEIAQTNESVNLLNQNWVKITATAGTAGVALEAMARGQAGLTESTHNLANSLGMTSQEVRRLAIDTANVTFPLEDVLSLMETGKQLGLTSAEALQQYATFWDTVGDATGLAATQLGEAGTALKAVGIAAGEEEKAIAAFGYITEHTTGNVQEFLEFIGRTGPQLREMQMSVDDAAAVLGILEREMGMTGRTARSEFNKAVNEADGDLNKLLATLGITEEQYRQYTQAVADSADVIQSRAQVNNDQYTLIQKLGHELEELKYRFGETIQGAADFSMVLMGIGPGIKLWQDMRQWINLSTIATNAKMVATGLLDGAYKALTITARVLRGVMATMFGPVGIAIMGAIALGYFLIKNWETIREIGEPIWKTISGIITAVPEYVAQKWNEFTAWVSMTWEGLGDLAKHTWDNVADFITLPIIYIQAKWSEFASWIVGSWDETGKLANEIWNTIAGFIMAVPDYAQAKWNGFIIWIGGNWREVSNLAREIWSNITSIIISPADYAQAKWSSFKQFWVGLWGDAKQTVYNTVNDIIGQINRMIDRINRIPGINIGNIGAVGTATSIPKFHTGGVFRAPVPGGEGLALLKDGETIIPAGVSTNQGVQGHQPINTAGFINNQDPGYTIGPGRLGLIIADEHVLRKLWRLMQDARYSEAARGLKA